MGKGDTKTNARRNRAKLAKADPFKLAPIKRRGRDGKQMRADRPTEDPRAVALQARCRMIGLQPTPDNLREVSSPDYGHPALIAIRKIGGRDADRLREAFIELDLAEHRFFALVLNMSRFANVAKLEFLPEIFEARADDSFDLRPHDEKVAAAKKRWYFWLKRMKVLTGHEHTLIDDALRRYAGFVRDGSVTTSGQAFVAAMRVLVG